MAISKLGFEVIARTANNFIAKPEKERGSVLSTAQRHTNFLDDPRIVAALERSDFTMADLKTKAKTIYIVLPPNKLATNSRFLRGFIGLALAAITGSNIRPRLPVVFMLDEFAQLGRMAAVEDAIPLVRGYGAAFGSSCRISPRSRPSIPNGKRSWPTPRNNISASPTTTPRATCRRCWGRPPSNSRPEAPQTRISSSVKVARVPASNSPGGPC